MTFRKNKKIVRLASGRFVENLRNTTNNFSRKKRPAYSFSPFKTSPFISRQEIKLKDLTITNLPEITYYTDTHLVAPQLVNEGYDALASGRRRFFGLSRLHIILKHVRLLDDISYIMLNKIGPYIMNRYRRGGLVVHGGDVIDSYEAGNCFRTFAALERFHDDLYSHSGARKSVKTSHIWVTGNHDAFFGGLGQWFEYNQFKRSYSSIPRESFIAIVKALEAGWPWPTISEVWQDSYKREGVFRYAQAIKCALHPALRWYLQKLTFGPAQGLFLSKKKKNKPAEMVYFLDSELMTLHGGAGALARSLKSEGFTDDDSLFDEIMRWRRQEHKVQAALIKSLAETLVSEARLVVYAHNPRQQQAEFKQKFSQTVGRLIEDRVIVYGGHYHTADQDVIKMPKGVKPVLGATRIFIGPFGQKPGRFPFAFSFNRYFDSLAPEILDGSLVRPQKIKIIGVRQAVERSLQMK